MRIKYILPAIKDSPEATCAIRNEDGVGQVSFVAKYGVYEVSKNDETLCRLLERNGWKVLALVEEDGDKNPVVAEVIAKRDYARKIKLAHPDLTEDFRPSSTYTFAVEGENVDAKVEDGIIESKNPRLIRVLIEKGYRVLNPHTLETEEEKLK